MGWSRWVAVVFVSEKREREWPSFCLVLVRDQYTQFDGGWLRSGSLTELTRQITPPTKNGRAQPHRKKKELSVCQSLLRLDRVSFPVLSQIKPLAPLLVAPKEAGAQGAQSSHRDAETRKNITGPSCLVIGMSRRKIPLRVPFGGQVWFRQPR